LFTDSSIKSLKPRKYRFRLTENIGRRGIGRLVLDVSVNGKKAFYFQYYRQRDGKSIPALIRIGLYKESTKSAGYKLNEARDKALEFSELLKRNIDIKDFLSEQKRLEEQKQRQIELEKRQGDFEQLIESYLSFMEVSGKRTHLNVRKSFNAYVLKPFPEMIKRKANQIEADDIRIIIGRMLDRGITTQCNRVRSHLHAAFQHGLKSDHDPRSYTPEKVRFNLKYNPVGFIPKQSDFERVGEHVISQEEIAYICGLLPIN
jgi:Arm DNA-binding domain